MRRRFVVRLGGKRGMALILVVLVLSAMLMLGTAFMQNIRLDFKAATAYSQEGQTQIFALEGLHRGMSELMYDVWGVNESRAFACSPEWGQLSKGYSVDGTPVIAAYAYDGDPAKQIISARAKWRRTCLDPNFQTDYTWINEDGAEYGGNYWDEFLPEHTDNGDVFEMALMANHGLATDRNFKNDAKSAGGLWYGAFFPAKNYGDTGPWDYIDTRIAPDSFYHIFRSDLVDPADKRVRCTGIRNQDPMQVIARPKNDNDFRATHIGFAGKAGWIDSWGGAININQVNSNYKWEQYVNSSAYGSVPTWTDHHFNESKWIYIYTADGTKRIGRYAVNVFPDCGSPGANYLFDAGVSSYLSWAYDNQASANYLLSLDGGFLPHGNPGKVANRIKAEKPKHNVILNKQDLGVTWAHVYCTEVNNHIRASGPLTSRAELAMYTRKDAFQEYDAADGSDNSDNAVNDAIIMTSLMSVSSYEYLLDEHWEADRLIIDSTGAPSWYKNMFMPEGLGNDTSSGKNTKRYFNDMLNRLQYYWGPDDIRADCDGQWSKAFGFSTKYTPYHIPGSLKSQDWQDVVDSRSGSFKVGPPTFQAAKELRARRARASAMSWIMTNTDFWAWYGTRNHYSVNCETGETMFMRDGTQPEQRNWVVSTTGPHAIREVGRYTPKHPTATETDGPDPVDGSALQEYYFIELVQNFDMTYRPIHGNLETPSKNCFLYVSGKDVLRDPRTKIVQPDFDVDNDGKSNWDTDLRTMGKMNDDRLCWMEFSSTEDPPGSGTWRGDLKREPPGGDFKGWFPWLCTVGFNKAQFVSGQGQQSSAVRDHPATTFVVYFPTDIDVDMSNPSISYVGDRAYGYPGNQWRMIDYVELPGRISDLGANESYSVPDFFNNDLGTCWQKTPATPAWRYKYDGTTSKQAPYYPDGVPSYFPNGPRWAGGVNADERFYMWPDNRVDITNTAGPFSWPACGRCQVSMTYFDQPHHGNPLDTRKIPLNFMPCYQIDELKNIPQNNLFKLVSQDVQYPSAEPYELYKPSEEANEVNRAFAVMDFYDPDFAVWEDLYRVTPLEQMFCDGSLPAIPAWGVRLPVDHPNYVPFDNFDNDMNGLADDFTTQPLSKDLRVQGYEGHFNGDRKALGRINVNDMVHPASVHFAAINGNANPMAQVGRKPLKGYNSIFEIQTRTFYYSDDTTPYNRLVWSDNLFADCSTDHIHWEGMSRENDFNMYFVARIGYAGHSPVYTMYVTAEAIKELPDRTVQPVSSVRIRSTVERTWDGKMNVLEFNWIPQDVQM